MDSETGASHAASRRATRPERIYSPFFLAGLVPMLVCAAVLFVYRGEIVQMARLDSHALDFDSELWKAGDRDLRTSMAPSLENSELLMSKSFAEVVELLGPPDEPSDWQSLQLDAATGNPHSRVFISYELEPHVLEDLELRIEPSGGVKWVGLSPADANY